MTKVIYKYRISTGMQTKVELPKGANIIRVGYQGGSIYAWCEVDPSEETTEREFRIYGTGEYFNHGDRETNHLGSVVTAASVWHVYELGATLLAPGRTLP